MKSDVTFLTSKMATIGRAIALAAVLATGGALTAQTVRDEGVPASVGLDIPANLQVFGTVDPNVRKPTAIVNGTVITGTDIDQRQALLLAGRDIKLSPEETGQLKLQILRGLIDEALQIQEAKSAEVTIKQDEIDSSYTRVVAQNFGKSVPQMRTYLRSIGSSERSLKRQIEAELAWNRFLRRKVDVNVGDEEVAAIIDRLKKSQGSTEYHVREIYLGAEADRAPEVFAQAREMIASIQKREKGEDSFGYYARCCSIATTRSTGGDLDWLSETQLAQLPPTLTEAIKTMQPEQLAGPIEVPGGFSIIYLVDTRRIGVADARDAKLTLKQLSVRFPEGITQEQANARVTEFAAQTKTIRGCGEVAKIAAQIGAEVVDNDSVKIRDLPGALQEIMLKLSIGESTPPFGSAQDGIRSLVLCGRDDPKGGELPGVEQVRNSMENSRVNLRANQMLRDIRRDAVIEYR